MPWDPSCPPNILNAALSAEGGCGQPYGRIMVLRKRGRARGSTMKNRGQRCVARGTRGARLQFVSRQHGPLLFLYLLGAGTEHLSNRTRTSTLAKYVGRESRGLEGRVSWAGRVRCGAVQGQMTFPRAVVGRRLMHAAAQWGMGVEKDCTGFHGGRERQQSPAATWLACEGKERRLAGHTLEAFIGGFAGRVH
jgi:hypothetical protein